MWVCECGYIPEVMFDIDPCEMCRQPASFVWIDECYLDDCVHAMEKSALCPDCQLKVREAFGPDQ